MLDLTQSLAAAACFACLLIAGHALQQERAWRAAPLLLAGFFLLMGAQLALLAATPDADAAQIFTWSRALLALLVLPVGYAFILALRGPLARNAYLHLLPVTAGVAALVFDAPDALDYLILATALGYTLALAHLIPAGRGQFAALAPNQAHGFAWLCALTALFAVMALIDASLLVVHQDGVALRQSPILSLGMLTIGAFVSYVILGSLNRPSLVDWLHARTRYEASTLAPGARAALAARVSDALGEASALADQNLTVLRLSRRLGVPARHVTEAINSELNRSFSELLNERRIALAQVLLRSEPDTTIVDICHRVGYASKSNFNREFRKRTGQTPSEFRAHPASSR